MLPFADIYVLSASRTEAEVSAFLLCFAPEREESAADYWIPRYADAPKMIFHTASEVISYCCSHTSEQKSVYWRRIGDGNPAYVMVFFTSDARLILGLSVTEEAADQFLAELRRHANSEIGYITRESPPPGTAGEFCQIANGTSAKLFSLPRLK